MVRPPKPPSIPSVPRFKERKKDADSGREAIFRKLGELSNRRATPEHYEEYAVQVEAEKNHRGAVLLIGANIELALETAISRLCHHERLSILFGPERPLGSFRNKIYIGYALELYGPKTFNNLEVVRNIRNAFAHAKIPISFQSKEVSDACALIELQSLFPTGPQMSVDETTRRIIEKKTGMERFKYACNWLGHNLHSINFGGVLKIEPHAVASLLNPAHLRIEARQEPLP